MYTGLASRHPVFRSFLGRHRTLKKSWGRLYPGLIIVCNVSVSLSKIIENISLYKKEKNSLFIFDTFTIICQYNGMREIIRHKAGRIYLIALLLSIIGFIVFLALGGTAVPENGSPILVFGWMTMPLFAGILFVVFWLVTYIIYFFFFWPYR